MAINKPSIVEAHVPVMAMTALDLRRLLGRRTTQNRDLQRVALRDPATAVALFRYVRRLRRDASDELSDAGHAISLIGFDAFRRLLRQLPVLEPGEQDWLAPTQVFQASNAAHAAHYARFFAVLYEMIGADEIANAALLQDPAVLALWSTEPQAAAHAARQVRAGRPFDEAYAEQLGEPLQAANQWVAESWGLPSLTVEAFGTDPGIDRRARLARLCAGLARASGFDWGSAATAEQIEQLAEFLHRPVERVSAQLHRAMVQAARDLRPVGYPVAAFSCLYLPASDGSEIGPLSEPAPASRFDGALLDTLQNLLRHAGLQRVAFVALNRTRGQLLTHLALDVEPDTPLYDLAVPSAGSNLFGLLIAKPQAVWLNTDNRERYAPYLTAELSGALNTENCFAMSVFVGGKPLGLICGDGFDLSDDGYDTFRRLIREARQQLSSAAA